VKKEGMTLKEFQHYVDSSEGLWCIDRDPKEVSHDWIKKNSFQLTTNK